MIKLAVQTVDAATVVLASLDDGQESPYSVTVKASPAGASIRISQPTKSNLDWIGSTQTCHLKIDASHQTRLGASNTRIANGRRAGSTIRNIGSHPTHEAGIARPETDGKKTQDGIITMGGIGDMATRFEPRLSNQTSKTQGARILLGPLSVAQRGVFDNRRDERVTVPLDRPLFACPGPMMTVCDAI